MKSFAELREQAWTTMRQGGWVMKFFVVWVILLSVVAMVQGFWNGAVASMGIQTWTAFLEAKAKAIASGMDLTVPSRAMAIRMCEASAFEVFVSCILNGILCYATYGLFLRAAKGEKDRWFAASFGGFRYPLGVAALYFRYGLQILLWSLLFLVPGLVAVYRYSQCWNMKFEHPDWSAGKCLAESGRLMKGQKWNRFVFDCSYWKPITIVLLGLLAMSVVVMLSGLGMVPPSMNGILTVALLVLSVVCAWGGLVLAAYMSIGQALFYLEIRDDGYAAESEGANA